MALSCFINRIILLFVVVLIAACASVVQPSGGPKDTTPPQVVEMDPENKSLNFKRFSPEIELEFDEFIQLREASKQLIVSPPLKYFPDLKVRGKKLIVQIKDTLHENTTYSMNFGQAIRDINESNPMDNFVYVFSTGAYLDSLSFTGNVKSAFDLTNEEDVFVMIYEQYGDSVPYQELPNYYGKTNSSGDFRIDNIKKAAFKMFALKDANANFLYDQVGEEKIAFIDSLVKPHYIAPPPSKTAKDSLRADTLSADSIPARKTKLKISKTDTLGQDTLAVDSITGDSIQNFKHQNIYLRAFTEEPPKLYLEHSSSPYYGKLQFVFNKPPGNPRFRPLNHTFKKSWNIPENSVTGDTITLWLTNQPEDSLIIEVSDGREVIDTAEIKLKEKSAEVEQEVKGKLARGKRVLTEFKLALEKPLPNSHHPKKQLSLRLNHPVKSYERDSLILTQGEDTLQFELSSADTALRQFYISHEWIPDSSYQLKMLPGAFTDIFDMKNDTISGQFKVNPLSEYGNLILNMEPATGDISQYVLQLLKAGKVVSEEVFTGNRQFKFAAISPGNYSFRLIHDENQNGKWDTGNYLRHRQPEKVSIHGKDVKVRANWDMEIEWIMDEEKTGKAKGRK